MRHAVTASRSAPCSSTVSSTTPSRSMSIASAMARPPWSVPSWNTSSKPASTLGTPPASFRRSRSPTACTEEIDTAAKGLARELEVRGLMNIQFAVKDDELYVIEVNPRASRTVPFVSKSTGVSLAKLAAKVMVGEKLADMGLHRNHRADTCLGQGSRLPMEPLPRHRHRARPGNEIHRRGHGHRC